ncbi:methyltransferase domain-containing protein [Dermabacteraceae bacterium TAE3-ERU5]|nr:methyltransferase domain-containing protein [Dermabacteraceae bacterium TAE3-ERU5]
MDCTHYAAGDCTSCTLLPVPYPDQVSLVDARLRELLGPFLARDGEWLPPALSATSRFRNKAKLVVSGDASAPILGLRGVELTDCPLYPPAITAAVEPIRELIRRAQLPPYDPEKHRGELRHVLITASPDGGLLIRFVLRTEKPLPRIREHLSRLLSALPETEVFSCNLHPERVATLEGAREVMLHGDTLLMRLSLGGGELPLHLRPRSFFQTNTQVAQALYTQVADWVGRVAPVSVWDLFCGVGGFALACASLPGGGPREITGVEVSEEAIASARRSARELGVSADFFATDARAWLGEQESAAEMVIVNPPRRGIGKESTDFFNRVLPAHLVYSSCNPQSLARDLARMPGYRISAGRLFDMFPHTDHAEVAVLLTRIP